MAAQGELISVLVGPTCPACEADDLRGPSSPDSSRTQCPACGTTYLWYAVPPDDDLATQPQPTCRGCGVWLGDPDPDAVFCEDCGPSDCAYCGATTLRWMLSENLACSMCEDGEVAA